VYYRYTLVLQGEQDVLEVPGQGTPEDELSSLLKQLEAGPESPQQWEEQIHWEQSGVVCAPCRSVVVRTLAPASGSGSAGTH
jgi:hypothetical protein